MQNQTADVEWRGGEVPVSTRFDDPYFSLENGLAETRHVFLAGNDLPERFRDGFHIAELGFGTGLNFLTAVQCWQEAGARGKLQFTSFEAYPMHVEDMARAHSAFEELDPFSTQLLACWRPEGGIFDVLPNLRLQLIVGDARKELPRWKEAADAWFLDGFSPAKNPELWSPELMGAVGLHTACNGTCATYTAAGFVRRGLAEAGFDVKRVKGFGRKRHMTRGVLRA